MSDPIGDAGNASGGAQTEPAGLTLNGLYARICQFVKNYGGSPPESSSPKSLDMISDFMLVIDAELNWSIRKSRGSAASPGEKTEGK